MRGVIVTPGVADSLALVDDLPEPPESDGAVLVEGLAVGVCGTDREIIAGEYGTPPPKRDRLVIGHESVGRVLRDDSGTFPPGQLVAGIVRHPDPVPCGNCAVGEWDMCRNGGYTEHGIKELDGFARERWRVDPAFAVPLPAGLDAVGTLLEPTSVVAKAWEHIERLGSRARWEPSTVLVTGAGPIGLLAALLGRQRGLETYVVDMVTDGLKPGLVRAIGATYHAGPLAELDLTPDIVLECTGVGALSVEVMAKAGPNGVVCLTGVSTGGRRSSIDVGLLNRELVLENTVVFGSVNANRRHWEQAAAALAAADLGWLGALINRRVPIDRYADAYERAPDDVKVVLELSEA